MTAAPPALPLWQRLFHQRDTLLDLFHLPIGGSVERPHGIGCTHVGIVSANGVVGIARLMIANGVVTRAKVWPRL